MISRLSTVCAFFALFLVSSSARAGLLIEPYVGYASAKQTATITGSSTPGVNGTSSINGGGAYYGGRLGYAYSALVAGGEYSLGNVKLGDTKTAHHEIYAFAGVRLPVLLNVLFGYVVSNDADDTGGDGGYKAALQLRILPLVNLNLEYYVTKTKGLEPAPAGPSAGMDMKADTKGFGVSVSLPLEL